MLSAPPEMPVYTRMPLTLVAGRGAHVIDDAGRDYLDLYGGHAVASTGHCHPRVTAAIAAQAGRLIFYSNAVDLPVRRELCARLLALGPAGMTAVFLCNSGAEANENALTLARLATGRPNVVAVSEGFHGRTMLTLSLAGFPKFRALAAAGGAPLYAGARLAPFGDLDAAAALLDETCAAIIIEPVQGLGGGRPATTEYLAGLRALCDRRGAKLIFDEVQCGAGRCGAFTAGQRLGVAPHLTTLAKGLAAGVPIGAVLADAATTAAAKPGALGSTFGGGPLACAAAVANLEAMQEEDMFANAARVGAHWLARLPAIPGVRLVQGLGLLVGVRLDRPAAPVRAALLARGIIVGDSAAPDMLRLLPPLNLTIEDADRFVEALAAVLQEGTA
jgi:acetylornithine/succinyldiaminopimelate/putrescine aminotransferase